MITEKRQVVTVSELTNNIKGVLEGDFSNIWLIGEVSNFRKPASGHCYFTLKDEQSQIKAVLFKYQAYNLKFQLADGLKVIVHGKVSVYVQRGEHQIIVDKVEPAGLGALQLAYEQLKAKLEQEGLFNPDHKQLLPAYPAKIGVVTSSTGAAFRDILNIIERRFSNVHVILYPARVQGERAASEICAGITYFNKKMKVDVLIVGRGGGSLEDLWAFNEEVVARAIFNSKIPIVSAVGHEIDFTISDFVADLRAPTPSAAAELVVRDKAETKKRLRQLHNQLQGNMNAIITYYRQSIDNMVQRAAFQKPRNLLIQKRQYLDELDDKMRFFLKRFQVELCHKNVNFKQRLDARNPRQQLRFARNQYELTKQKMYKTMQHILKEQRGQVFTFMKQLQVLSPLATLERGYAICWKMPDKKLVASINQVARGDSVCVKVNQGEIFCRVEDCNG